MGACYVQQYRETTTFPRSCEEERSSHLDWDGPFHGLPSGPDLCPGGMVSNDDCCYLSWHKNNVLVSSSSSLSALAISPIRNEKVGANHTREQTNSCDLDRPSKETKADNATDPGPSGGNIPMAIVVIDEYCQNTTLLRSMEADGLSQPGMSEEEHKLHDAHLNSHSIHRATSNHECLPPSYDWCRGRSGFGRPYNKSSLAFADEKLAVPPKEMGSVTSDHFHCVARYLDISLLIIAAVSVDVTSVWMSLNRIDDRPLVASLGPLSAVRHIIPPCCRGKGLETSNKGID